MIINQVSNKYFKKRLKNFFNNYIHIYYFFIKNPEFLHILFSLTIYQDVFIILLVKTAFLNMKFWSEPDFGLTLSIYRRFCERDN